MTRKTLDRIDTMVAHTVGGCHTEVVYRQKRICIYPDQKTGEFAADLFPVKYKLTQLTAQGYSTLTNGNTGMQVIDLTNRLTSDTLRNNGVEVVYNDTFRHVYHSPVSISLRQLQYGMEQGYLGIEKTYLTDFDSVAHIQDMVCKNALGEYEYLFGKPVFNEGKYSFRITAHEDYYYNGNRTQGVHDQVMLHGGKIQIYNGMHSEKEILSSELDANGQMQTVLQADYPTYTRLGDDALRRIVVSVEHNGEYVQSEPVERSGEREYHACQTAFVRCIARPARIGKLLVAVSRQHLSAEREISPVGGSGNQVRYGLWQQLYGYRGCGGCSCRRGYVYRYGDTNQFRHTGYHPHPLQRRV